jgi:sulfoxide reductase catalytic subunit YedY
MHVIRKRGWEIPERLATPEAVWLNRRQIMAGGAALVAGVTLPSIARAQTDRTIDLYPAPRNNRYSAGRPVTPEAINTGYNNFYEFGMQKDVSSAAEALEPRPWEVAFDGMVENRFTIGIDDLVRRMGLEERLYRHRCVEPWSMTVPWTGFPLARMVAFAKPLGGAKYVRFEAFDDSAMASGQRQSWYPWPYVEGLTMAEATSELAFMVTGAYGKPVAKVMGAPLRLHVPWKYGFKSIKSVVRVSFTDEQPQTFWRQLRPRDYGFWANVNPDVPNPRWSQASERDIGSGETIPTQIYNGYGEYVAAMYSGLTDEPLFM